MRHIVKGLWVAGLVVALAMPALAQQGKGQRKGQGFGGGFGQGPGMMGMAGNAMQVLANAGVQKELKLTDEQVGKITTMAREQMEQGRERFQGLRDATPEERREIMTKMSADARKAIAGVLKDDQMKRFDQIRIQNMYLAAFEDEIVVKALKITDEQKAKVRDLQGDMMRELRDSFQPGGGGDRGAMMEKMTALRKATFEKGVNLLTSEQKMAWKELIGEPFEVRFEPRRID